MLEHGTDIKPFIATRIDDVKPPKRFPWARPKPVGPPKICITSAFIVVVINIILTIVAFSIGYSKHSPNGFVTVPLYIGSCTLSKNWSIGLHVLINALGTAMLAASNYCAQYLAAPTREDVDQAHAHGSWMDIGIPSLRNIRRMKWQNKALWIVLMVTSLPNHLIYNSVILNARSSNEYTVMVGPHDYNGSKPLNVSDEVASCFPKKLGQSYSQLNGEIETGNFDVLTREQCMKKLAVNFPSGQGTVMILSNNLTLNEEYPFASAGLGNAIHDLSMDWPSYQWMCPLTTPDGCPLREMEENIDNWSVSAIPWVGSDWEVTVPAENDQTVTYLKSNYTGCPGWANTTYCDDLARVAYMAWEYGGASARRFNSSLHDLDQWGNSDWAAEVRFKQAKVTCRPTDTSMHVGEMGDSYTVDGCLSMHVDESCQLLFIPSFAIVVIGCGLIKLACIAVIAHRASTKKLLTVGDAIASFLTHPDPHTMERCLTSKSDWTAGHPIWKGQGHHQQVSIRPRELLNKTKWWWQAGSPVLWTLTISLCSVALGVAGYLLDQGLQDNRLQMLGGSDIKSLWNLGLGTMSFATTIARTKSSMMANVLLANVPQLFVSFSYYFYNALMTSMIVSNEYDHYAIGTPTTDIVGNPTIRPNKALRVSSHAQGVQRVSYFLGLPSRYSLPLMITYALLHWLVSQSLFYIRVLYYDVHGRYVESADINACGWSPMAIILAIAVGGLMVLVLFPLGMRRFRSQIPLAASCSAAISAACHPPPGDSGAALRNIVWGEVTGSSIANTAFESEDTQKIAHCSFTSQEVRIPSAPKFYV
ncbi:uncharacterized protein KD926_001158 [Aspergillus affinis]|uniref:uncharacterized protein n=1 Tax=Aspergillus affinis TaxID=1070780 RepID=UPI0022FE0887|nr:uncharacterized protein KD926_001158 [Aspergillus affinis]KAI9036914.1 hypothetical protein KD926_001158 [Aspergillus affinis]